MAPLSATAALTVSFPDPSRYTDAGADAVERERVTQDIERHLQGLAQRYLPPQQELKIEVLDIDLAGRIHHLRHSTPDVRVLNGGADWPAIKLRYSLQANAKTKEGSSHVDRDAQFRYIND